MSGDWTTRMIQALKKYIEKMVGKKATTVKRREDRHKETRRH